MNPPRHYPVPKTHCLLRVDGLKYVYFLEWTYEPWTVGAWVLAVRLRRELWRHL